MTGLCHLGFLFIDKAKPPNRLQQTLAFNFSHAPMSHRPAWRTYQQMLKSGLIKSHLPSMCHQQGAQMQIVDPLYRLTVLIGVKDREWWNQLLFHFHHQIRHVRQALRWAVNRQISVCMTWSFQYHPILKTGNSLTIRQLIVWL